MRERTTWNVDVIVKRAAANKVADDPSVLNNPEHLKAQPAPDAYSTGGPSEFGEDIHPSSGTWKAEYSGGAVKRNEIGMPEMRGDTFNHKEKTAKQADQEDEPKDEQKKEAKQADDEEDMDEEMVAKKANLCGKIATLMLSKTASDKVLEDQAVALMKLSTAELIDTYNRQASEQEEQKDEPKDEQKKEAKQAEQEPEKKDEAQGQQDQGKQAQTHKVANPMEQQAAQMMQAMQQGDMTAAMAAMQQMMQAMQQGQQQPQGQQGQQMAAQPQQAAQQQQAAGTAGVFANDDQLLDQLLQGDGMDMGMGDDLAQEFQLSGPSIDMGEPVLAAEEDERLRSLFANSEEYNNALAAQAIENGGYAAVPPAAGVRTASTRTVGTRPTGGVPALGGAPSAPAHDGGEIGRLSSLWRSAPDISDTFR